MVLWRGPARKWGLSNHSHTHHTNWHFDVNSGSGMDKRYNVGVGAKILF